MPEGKISIQQHLTNKDAFSPEGMFINVFEGSGTGQREQITFFDARTGEMRLGNNSELINHLDATSRYSIEYDILE